MKQLKYRTVERRVNETVNRLNKTKEERNVDWQEEKRQWEDGKRRQERAEMERRKKEEAARLEGVIVEEKMETNKAPKTVKGLEDDFFKKLIFECDLNQG
jgi:hypothetical protein